VRGSSHRLTCSLFHLDCFLRCFVVDNEPPCVHLRGFSDEITCCLAAEEL